MIAKFLLKYFSVVLSPLMLSSWTVALYAVLKIKHHPRAFRTSLITFLALAGIYTALWATAGQPVTLTGAVDPKRQVTLMESSGGAFVTIKYDGNVIWDGIVPAENYSPNLHGIGVPLDAKPKGLLSVSGGPYFFRREIDWSEGGYIDLAFDMTSIHFFQQKDRPIYQ